MSRIKKPRSPSGKTRDHPASSDDAVTPWFLFFILLAMLALHLYATFYPSHSVWGVLHAVALPAPWRMIVGGLGLILILPPVAFRLARLITRLKTTVHLTAGAQRTFHIALPAVLFAMFFILRSRAQIFGDGFRMLERLANPDSSILFNLDLSREFLGLAWPWLNHHLWAKHVGFSPGITYGVLNSIAGLLLVYGLARLVRHLFSSWPHQLLAAAALGSSGTLLLAFGYVESYPWALTAATWSLVFAVRATENFRWWWISVLFLSIAVAFHLLTMVFLPAVVLGGWRQLRHKFVGESGRPALWGFISVGFLGLVGSFVGAKVFGLQYFVFSPPGQSNPYSLLSGAHLIDVVNILLLAAPAMVIALLPRWAKSTPRTNDQQNGWVVILFAAACAVWITVLIDPSLGAMRDWDLLSFFGPSLSLLAVWLFLSRHGRISARSCHTVTVQLCGLFIFHCLPWINLHQNPTKAIEVLDTVLADDPHLTSSYDDAMHALDFSRWLTEKDVGRYDLATKYFLRRLRAVPDDPDAWWNLGGAYYYRGIVDSGAAAYQTALQCDSTTAWRWYRYAQTLFDLGDHEPAKHPIRQSLRYDSTTHIAAGVADVYQKLGDYEFAGEMFERAVEDSEDPHELHLRAGKAFLRTGKNARAQDHFRTMLRINPKAPNAYRRLLEIAFLRSNIAEADSILKEWMVHDDEGEAQSWAEQLIILIAAENPHGLIGKIFGRMGSVYVEKENYGFAADLYDHAADLDPTLHRYREMAKTLRRKINNP